MAKTILGALSVLVVLLLVYLLLGRSPYTSTQRDQLSAGFEGFKQVEASDISRIVLEKGKGTVELERQGGEWVVASSFGYSADEEQVRKLLESLSSIRRGVEVGTRADSFVDFEVDEENGGFITLYGKGAGGEKDSVLASLVVGKYATGHGIGSSHVYVRFGEETVTYDVESDLRSDARLYSKDAEGKNYLQTEIFKLPEKLEEGGPMEIETVRLVRPEEADVIVERRMREVPVEDDTAPPAEESPEGESAEKKDEEPKTKKEPYYVVTCGSETHDVGKDEEWTARGLLDRGKTIRIEDVAEPKDLAEYGLEEPQLKAILAYRKKDTPEAELNRLTLLFGNAKKDEEGKTRSYYFAIDGEKYQNRVYLIQDYTFDGWNKELKDFLPKPKEETKPSEGEESSPAEGAEATEPGAETPAEEAAPTESSTSESPPGDAPAVETPSAETPTAEGPPEGSTGASDAAPAPGEEALEEEAQAPAGSD